MKPYFLMLMLLLSLSLLIACVPVTAPAVEVGMPNPASENCIAQGGTLDIRQGEGGEVGYCVFADGSECEEWALMRGECAPSQGAETFADPFAYCAAVGTGNQLRCDTFNGTSWSNKTSPTTDLGYPNVF